MTGNTLTGFVWSDDVASFTSKGDDVSLDVTPGATYVLGIQVSMSGATSGDWVLQVREDGVGSWLPVFQLIGGESQVWETDDTHTFTKANADVIAIAEFGHTGTPAGFGAVDGEFSDDNNGLTDDYAATSFTELQYTIRAAGTVTNHSYEFRVTYNGAVLDLYGMYATANGPGSAATSAVAEISPNDVATNSTGNTFTYAIKPTITGGDTGVDRVTIAVPSTFGDPTVDSVQVGGSTVPYTDNTVGKLISVLLTTKLIVTDSIQVVFTANAPVVADATGRDFTSTVDDAGTGTPPLNTTEGSADSELGDSNSWTVTTTTVTYAVAVTPVTTAASRLPSNGTNYTVDFTVTNNGSDTDDFDLLTTQSPGTAIAVVSMTGTGVTQGANPDNARVSSLTASGAVVVTVTYSVADVAGGTADTLLFAARSVGNPATIDNGRLELTVIRPNLTTNKAVNPNGTQLPGTELTYTLTYTLTITNDGTQDAAGVVVLDSLAVELDFKVGSVVNNLPSGVTATVEYSNDAGSSWTYVPVSAGCSAPASFDSCLTHIRWTLDTDLSYVGPDNTGNVEFIARIQ